MESTGKKGEDGDIWVYMCGGQKTREKKKKETYGWKKGNTNTIFLQYFHSKF